MKPTVLEGTGRTQRPPREEPLVLERRADGRLWAGPGPLACPVVVRRCFPWSEAGHWISLRDDDQREVALVRDPALLPEASRNALLGALGEAGFVFEVTRVTEVEEEVEIRHWSVETRQGARTFQTRLDDWQEVALVRDPALLPEASRNALLGALGEAGFVFEVTRVTEVEEEVEI